MEVYDDDPREGFIMVQLRLILEVVDNFVVVFFLFRPTPFGCLRTVPFGTAWIPMYDLRFQA